MSPGGIARWLKEHKWVRILGSALLLASLFLLFPRKRLVEGLRRLDLRVVAAAVPLFLLVHFMGALKWHLLLRRSGTPFRLSQSLQCYYFGLFGNLFLPSVVGGDAFMVALAARKTDKRAGILVASFLNRALDLLALVLLAGAAAVLIPGEVTVPFQQFLRPALVVAGVIVLVAGLTTALRPAQFGGTLRKFLEKHSDALALVRSPQRNVAPLAFSIVIQFGLIAINVWVAEAGGLHLSWAVWLLCWPLAKVTSMVPVAVGGIGTRELALVALMTPFGAPAERVVATGLAWEVIRAFGGLTGGGIWKAFDWYERPARRG